MNQNPTYKAYTGRLKASLLSGLRGDREHQPAPVDPIRLLDEVKQKFGDGLVCGLTPDSLAWLLEKNGRVSDTLAPAPQLDALQSCLERVIEEAIPGDAIEAGCFRGGQCILMAGVLQALGAYDRKIFAADSFAGLPDPDPHEAPDDAVFYHLLEPIGRFRASLDEVKNTLRPYGSLVEHIQFLSGWFHESLPAAPIESLAFIRLDATFYQSTRDAIRILYPKLSRGGFLICADYGVPTGARRAVDEYRLDCRIEEPIVEIDGQGILWRRED